MLLASPTALSVLSADHSKEGAHMNRPGFVIVAILFCALAAVQTSAQANLGGVPGTCDKGCLRTLADAYTAALVAHDPSRAAMAPGAKFTENIQTVNVGDGLWKTASEAPKHRSPTRLDCR